MSKMIENQGIGGKNSTTTPKYDNVVSHFNPNRVYNNALITENQSGYMVREWIRDNQGVLECFYLFKTLCDAQDFIRRTIDGMKDTVVKTGGDIDLDGHTWCKTIVNTIYDYAIVGLFDYSDDYCTEMKERFGITHQISSGTLDWRLKTHRK